MVGRSAYRSVVGHIVVNGFNFSNILLTFVIIIISTFYKWNVIDPWHKEMFFGIDSGQYFDRLGSEFGSYGCVLCTDFGKFG